LILGKGREGGCSPRGRRRASNQSQCSLSRQEYKVNTYLYSVNSNGLRETNSLFRKEVSGSPNFLLALAIGSIGKTRPNIFFREIGKFPQNVGMGHTAGQIFQHVVDSDA